MKNKLGKITALAAVSMALVVTGCSSESSSVAGEDSEEYIEDVESGGDEGASSSSVVHKDKKAKSSSSEKVESSDSEKAVSSSSEKVEPKSSETVESSGSEVIESSSSENIESSDATKVESSSSEAKEEKKFADCSEKPFPEELNFLLGRDHEKQYLGCDNDTIISHWRISHVTHEDVVEFASEIYIFSKKEDDYAVDSLNEFRYFWLEGQKEFELFNDYDMSRYAFAKYYRGYVFSDPQINCDDSEIEDKMHVYRYWKRTKEIDYWLNAYAFAEIIVDESGARSIRYGFTMDVEVYYRAEHYAKLGLELSD